MTYRTRTYPTAVLPRGTRTQYNVNYSTGAITQDSVSSGYLYSYSPGSCYDHLSPDYPRIVTEGDLDMVKRWSGVPRANGERRYPWGLIRKIVVWEDLALNPYWGSASDVSINGWGSEVINRLNPFKPVISLPYEWAELFKDLAILVGFLGFLVPKYGIKALIGQKFRLHTAAGAYVTYQFGIRPYLQLLDNLNKLAEVLEDSSDRIQKEVRKRRKVQLFSSEVLGGRSVTLSPELWAQRTVTVTTKHTQKVWAVCNFTLSAKGEELLSLFRRDRPAHWAYLVNHKNFAVTDAWNLIPFSWLADWLLDIGSLLEAYGNRVYFDVTSASICAESVYTEHLKGYTQTWTGSQYGSITVSDALHKVHRRRRRIEAVVAPQIRAVPVFTGQQLGILSSILGSSWLRR